MSVGSVEGGTVARQIGEKKGLIWTRSTIGNPSPQ